LYLNDLQNNAQFTEASMTYQNTLKFAKSILFAGLVLVSAPAFADTFVAPGGVSAPGVAFLLQGSTSPNYRAMYNLLTPQEVILTADVAAFIAAPGIPTYTTVDNAAVALANAANVVFGITGTSAILTSPLSARVVITLADGTVLVDTFRGATNTFANFETGIGTGPVAAAVPLFPLGMNHNTRIAIEDAQAWPSGVGIETKFSTTTSNTLSYVALRLGAYLNNVGTVRLSIPAPLVVIPS
jgi:hypothetical protein